jgi:hypothetical protein
MLSALHFNSYTFCTAFRFLCILIHCILILTIYLLFLSLHLKHACNLLRHCNSVCWQNYEKDNLTFDPLPWLNNFPFDISSCECYDNTKNMLYTVENAYELRYSREISYDLSCILIHALSPWYPSPVCPTSNFIRFIPSISIPTLSALHSNSFTFCPASHFRRYLPCILIHTLSAQHLNSYAFMWMLW